MKGQNKDNSGGISPDDMDSLDFNHEEFDRNEGQQDKKAEQDKKLAALCKIIDELYSKDQEQAPFVKKKLTERFEDNRAKGVSEVDEFLKLGEEIFEQRKKVKKEHTNTTRAKAEIIAFEQGKNPKATDLAMQLSGKNGVYVEEPVFAEAVKEDKRRTAPVIHTQQPSSYRRTHVFQAEKETSREMHINSSRVSSLIEDGKDIPEYEKKVSQPVFDSLTRLAGSATNLFTGVVGTLGKGIISSSDPRQSQEYQRIIRDRNLQLSKKVALLNPKKDNFAAMLQECRDLMGGDILTGNDADIDHATKAEMSALLNKWQGDLDAAYKTRLDQFDKDVGAWEKDMEKANAENVDAADMMWKWRALSMLLMVTPFAPLSLLGPIANFLGPILGSGGITQGILTVMNQFGPFSELMHLMKMDVAMEAILNHTPILSDLIEITDAVVGSDIIQDGFGDVIGAALGSPLTGVALGAGVFMARLPGELDHNKKVNDLRKNSSQKYKDLLSKFEKSRDDGIIEEEIEEADGKKGFKKTNKGPDKFIKDALKIRQDKNIPVKLAKFLTDEKTPQELKDKICQDLKIKKDDKEEDLKTLIQGQPFNAVYDMMMANPEVLKKARSQFLKHKASEENKVLNKEESQEALAKGKLYKSPNYSSEELVSQGERILEREMHHDLAEEAGMQNYQEIRNTESLKRNWEEVMVGRIRQMDKSAPSSKVKPKTFSEFLRPSNLIKAFIPGV